VNGVPLSAGPGRPIGDGSTIQAPALLYDTLNVTSLLRWGGAENVIAVESFYWDERQEKAQLPRSTVHVGPEPDPGDRGGVLVLLRS
jgi:hypothetical protein